ncbi:MAG: hypothetical protein GEU75_16320 [Dehalococcoidia bacterium]|nr:hypothetical protein [Dehalococcoidia bacterium]
MTQRIVIKSLEKLGRFADLVLPSDEPANERALVLVAQPDLETELATLAEAAGRAAEELRELADADKAARRDAQEAVALYRRIQEDATRLAHVADEAHALSEQASNLAERAFTPDLREKARQVSTAVCAIATSSGARLATVNAEAAALSTRQDVSCLLAEERAREDAVLREAEERRKEARLREQIEHADELARQGKGNEALRLLGHLTSEQPNEPQLASCLENVRRRAWAVKTVEVESAVREARRLFRREPHQALAILDDIDLADMPEELVRQVYGCWLQACRRLKLEGATHYSPAMGKGAVLVPADDGRLEVVSAIGLPRWKAGCRFSASALKGARPLR